MILIILKTVKKYREAKIINYNWINLYIVLIFWKNLKMCKINLKLEEKLLKESRISFYKD